jgi:cytochrome P450
VVVFEPFDPAIFDDPYPTYAQLRDEAPLYRGPKHRFWTLSRHADIKSALADPRLYSSDIARGGIGITPAEAGDGELPQQAHELPAGNLIVMDPPQHTAYRKVIAQRFLQKNMAPFEAQVHRVVDGLLDEIAERGEVDIVQDFAGAVPALVFADVLGVPQSRWRDLRGWAAELTTVPTTPDDAARHQDAVRAVTELFGEMLPYKQANPADDLLTDMALATGDGMTYSSRDFVGMATSMLIAGNDTTANLLASALYLFAKYPEQRARVIEDPALMANAVEEIVRYEPPVHGLARVLTRDTELYGQQLHEGEKVLLLYAAGNRDERVFPEGERFDVGRDTTAHLSFGHGVHYCVGVHLGRLESRVALRRFLERIPDYDVPLADIHWHHIFATRQMCSLPLTFEPAMSRAPA